ETVDFGEVLEAYGVTLKLRGADQHHGFCPLPNHDGQKRSPSFSANLARRIFHCFGCEAKGNAIDFVALMEGLNPDDPREIRKAALLIQERFLHEEAKPPPRPSGKSPPKSQSSPPLQAPPTTEQGRSPPQERKRPHRRQRHERPAKHPINPAASKPEPTPETSSLDPPRDQQPDNRERVVNRIINAPLDFELKSLDPNHIYLQERGLTPETIQTFGLGFCGRGMMAGRVAIPPRNTEGYLIGYAGRVVDDATIGAENPKYRLPGKREKDGTVFEFSKGAFLFNGHRVQAPATDLIVVEGFFSVFHLHQCGWTNAVALMGSSCSPEQAELIVKLTAEGGRVWLMPDDDDAGMRCAEDALMRVAPHRLVRWITLDEGKDPCNYKRDELA
ncbi:toprim domain-containing protein, partial [Candidatus Sumerlaeota bacterium]|nr:toprim domain-containing protein [Candidatus Sumerlaeota bacterium]